MKIMLAALAAVLVLAGCHSDPPVHNIITTPSASKGQARIPGLPSAAPYRGQGDPCAGQASIPGTGC